MSQSDAEILWGILRSLPEEDLRDIVHRYFIFSGLRSDIVHGTAEHGKDIVAVLPEDKDIFGNHQTLLVQVKAGDIDLGRWKREVRPQFDALSDSFIEHPVVDEKCPKRYILVFNGRLTEQAREAARKYNEKRDIPVEVIDLGRLVQILATSAIAIDLITKPGETLSSQEISNANIVMGCLLGHQSQYLDMSHLKSERGNTEYSGLSLTELAKRLPGMDMSYISRSIDLLMDSGLVAPILRSDSGLFFRAFRALEMPVRAYSIGEPPERCGLQSELEKTTSKVRSFIQEVISCHNVDFVICNNRKGARLLTNLLSDDVLPPRKIMDADLLDHVDAEELRGQSVLIFDDSVQVGSTMKSIRSALEARGALATEVCLILDKGKFAFDAKSLTCMKACTSEEDYIGEVSKVGLVSTSCNRPYEPGRPVLQFQWDDLEWPKIKEYLETVGNLYKIRDFDFPVAGSIYVIDNVSVPGQMIRRFPEFASLESPLKARVIFQEPNNLYIVPIVLPKVTAPSEQQVNSCPGHQEWEFPFCTNLPIAWFQSMIGKCCLSCTMFHEATNLGKSFFHHLLWMIEKEKGSTISGMIYIDQCEAFFRDRSSYVKTLFNMSEWHHHNNDKDRSSSLMQK